MAYRAIPQKQQTIMMITLEINRKADVNAHFWLKYPVLARKIMTPLENTENKQKKHLYGQSKSC